MPTVYLKEPEPSTTPVAAPAPTRLCYYFNPSSRVQVAKLVGRSLNDWERVVFPRDRILFDAPESAWLEVYSQDDRQTVLEQRLSCSQLACN